LYNNANTFEAENYDSFKKIVETGFARAWWCGNAECEDQVKAETQATIRCIPMEQPNGDGECIVCGTQAKEITIFSRAY
jgi:prolyl-tRNA synthetase